VNEEQDERQKKSGWRRGRKGYLRQPVIMTLTGRAGMT